MDLVTQLMDYALYLVDLFIHLDVHLNELVIWAGPWLYVILFAVIFCETGLVVTPVLPGDSLLFAVGALAAIPDSPIHPGLMTLTLFVAAVLGDAVNYRIGYVLGPKVFKGEDGRFLKRSHLQRTQAFYDKHGGKTIILARFMPIIRTFAPFVAGVGRMPYKRFGMFNVAGAALWVPPFLFGGYFLGNIPAIKTNFHIMVVLVVILSILPAGIEFWRSRRRSKELIGS